MDETEIKVKIKSCLNGNKESFTSVVRGYQRSLHHFCWHFLGNSQDAEDATVDIFLKVYRGLNSYNNRYRFSSWFYKIAFNHLVEVSRRKNREKKFFGFEMVHRSELTETETPDSIFFRNENREKVKNVLQSISLNQRTALMLRYYYQLSYRDIAHIMGVPKNTVAGLIFRGKNELRERLGREER